MKLGKLIQLFFAAFFVLGLILTSNEIIYAEELPKLYVIRSGDGTFTWSGAPDTVEYYKLTVRNNSNTNQYDTTQVTGNSTNVDTLITWFGFGAGKYTITLVGYEKMNGVYLKDTQTWELNNYDYKPRLSSPTVPSLNNLTFSWKGVLAATSYEVTFNDRSLTVNGATSCDISSLLSEGKNNYTVKVVAKANGYRDSAPLNTTFSNVVYYKNGAEITLNKNYPGAGKPEVIRTNKRARLSSIPTATRDGYRFIGWYDAPDSGTKITSNYIFEGDSTIYAYWEENPQSINISGGTADKSTALINSKVTITADEMSFSKFFDYWEVVSGGVTLEDPENYKTTFKMGGKPVSIKAHYIVPVEKNKLDISIKEPISGEFPSDAIIDGSGYNIDTSWEDIVTGKKLEKQDAFEEGREYKLSVNIIPPNTIYFGSDLSISINGSSDGVTSSGYSILQLVRKNYVAKAAPCVVSFDTNGGSAVKPQKVEKGQSPKIPADPTKDGYDFAGWYIDSSFNKAYDFGNAVTTDIKIYAKWNKKDSSGSGNNMSGGSGNNTSGGSGSSGTLENTFVNTSEGKQYYKEDGSLARNEWITVNNINYYINNSGYAASNEWIDGKWISEDGSCTYEGKLIWKSNATGWWVEDTKGWYPVSSWQKIDGIWYYFKSDGYMASYEYYNGYWFNKDGSWDPQYFLTWKSNATGWWVEDISGWWPSSCWMKIDGCWYYFAADGYMVTSQYVDGWWIDADGVCR